MLTSSDFALEDALQYFTAHDLEVGFLVPTTTGLAKSIMDAHGALRAFLDASGLHDFSRQPKGPQHKVLIEATVLGALEAPDTRVSLYRPETKDGDPRIWIYGLQSWARAGNLLALFVVDNHLYIANLSDPQVWESREDPDAPLGAVVAGFASEEDVVADELLGKLRAIARMGWVRSQRRGDTGIGFTLESLLGIRANARPEPDYKGIELKSGRGQGSGRNNLFAKTPDWKRSPISSTRGLLDEFGYLVPEKNRLQLFATVYGTHATPGGFRLEVGDTDVWLSHANGAQVRNLAVWSSGTLLGSLSNKHASTFWIRAEARMAADGVEEFLFQSVRYTRSPVLSAFVPLIATGGVTMDLTCFMNGEGAKDKGYLWKVTPKSFTALFPQPKDYYL